MSFCLNSILLKCVCVCVYKMHKYTHVLEHVLEVTEWPEELILSFYPLGSWG